LKILWVINIPLPEASLLLNEKPSPFGGWLINTSRFLTEQVGLELNIAFPKENINTIVELNGEKIKYFAFPKIKSNEIHSLNTMTNLKSILDEVGPDLVHIFGTEFEHTLTMINECNKKGTKFVLSIQGLVSVIAKHYMANLPMNIQKRYTFRDFIQQDNLIQQQKKFAKRGLAEVQAIEKAKHIIGRTTWDQACISQINPEAYYHFCNETLREEFYKHEWSIETCDRHTIFVSQGSYPIKGLHYILEAMSLLLKKFPDTLLYVAGPNILKSDSIKDMLKRTSYTKYIEELVGKYDLKNNIRFTGPLDEKKMCERYLKSHVFVCPSSIENSPNSLGEAMLLGVPSVASYAGGIPDILNDKEDGLLYQHDAPYMLAHYICELFENEDLALKFSNNARKRAFEIHDRYENTKELIEIYNEIITY